ncbi:MAG: outer membrane protein transport protein, partial [Neisseriaceae bacterium]|nr:outer membrane protein transport protein [Neisseriaceae bacterium]
AGVMGDDLSAVFYNSAGMTLLTGTQVQAGITNVDASIAFDGYYSSPIKGNIPGTENGRRPGLSLIPNLFMTHQVNEKLFIGLGVTAPFGLGTSYNSNWVGRNDGIESLVQTVDINPTIAYQLTPEWSIGGGISAQKASALLEFGLFLPGALGKSETSDWGFGYNLGAMYQKDALKVGLSFRSKVDHETTGDFTIQGIPGVNGVYDSGVNLSTPESVALTTSYRVSEPLVLSSTVAWTNWSRFDTVNIVTDSPGQTLSLENKWKDSWAFAVGADYKYSDAVTLRTGIGYSKTPIPSPEMRNALLPDGDSVRFSIGSSWSPNKNWTFDAGYLYMITVGDSATNHGNAVGGALVGEYDVTAHIIGLQMQYRY